MATTVNTLETDTEVFKGDRVVADGVERSLGDVTVTAGTTNSLTVGTATAIATHTFNNTLDSLAGGTSSLSGTVAYTASGKFGSALDLPANSSDLQSTGLAIKTISMWIYNDSSYGSHNTTILDARYVGGSGAGYLYGDGILIFADLTLKLDGTSVSTGQAYTKDVWHHLEITFNTPQTGIEFSNIGSTTADYGFGGRFDQMRFFDRVLTVEENTALRTEEGIKYTADFNTPLASIPTSVYRLDHDNLTILKQSNDSLLDDANQIAHYKFDGDATDRKGTYNGTATNVTYGTGKFGQCAVFNGSSSKITIKSSINDWSTALGTATEHSWGGWIKCSGEARLLGSGGTLSHIEIKADGTIRANMYDNAGNAVAYTNETVNDNQWHHIMCTWSTSVSSGKLFVYIDGVEATYSTNTARTTALSGNYSNTLGLYIGTNYNSLAYYAQSTDQVRIFDRALTSTEVESLYNEATTATTATVLDSRAGLIASGDTVLLDGVGVVCNPVVETEVSVLEPDGSLNTSTTDLCTGGTPFGTNDDTVNYLIAGAFDNNFNTYSVSTTAFFTSTQFKCGYTLPSEAVVNKYTITSGRMPQDEHRHPRTWTFEASTNTTDGEDGTWYILDTILDEPVWTGFETKTYTFINNTAYTSYRINVTNTTGTPDGNGVVQEMELIEAEDTKTIYQYDLTYPTQTAPTRIALSNNDVVPTVASDTFDGTDTFTKTYNTVTKTARDVEYGFVADDEVEIVQLNLNQNMEP